jgi:hypothetical protein
MIHSARLTANLILLCRKQSAAARLEIKIDWNTHAARNPLRLEQIHDHFESWKMIPRVWRLPDRSRLTPCRMLTR